MCSVLVSPMVLLPSSIVFTFALQPIFLTAFLWLCFSPVFLPLHGISFPCLIQACGFLSCRCHFSTFKQCQEWLSRLTRATARPAKPEDLFAFAYHAWCLGLTEEDQHTHLCQPGETRLASLEGCCFPPSSHSLFHHWT